MVEGQELSGIAWPKTGNGRQKQGDLLMVLDLG
jgi:hypothetical protein